MKNIIPFYNLKDERKKYKFINKPVMLKREEDKVWYPCIGLYHRGVIDTPVWYPLFERWYIPDQKAQSLASETLRKRSAAICRFLNYVLWETEHAYVHEVTTNDLCQYLLKYKCRNDEKTRSMVGWEEGVSFVYDFLVSYAENVKGDFDCCYRPESLIKEQAVLIEKTGEAIIKKRYNYFGVKAPKQLRHKNRLLLYGYLDLLLLECEMYDPELTIAVALQAYSGLREGEVVNLVWKCIQITNAGFNAIGDIILDIETPALHASDMRKTEFGNIKKTRKQKVYPSFRNEINKYYQAHMARHQSRGWSVDENAPVLLNKWGKPMSVDAYTQRLKKLFYDHFLPDLKKACELNNTWKDNAPFIEAYEEEYPGAHALRHWFTMFLFQHEHLSVAEIAKWRGDSSEESMNTYLHVNAELVESFKAATHTFQQAWLKEIL